MGWTMFAKRSVPLVVAATLLLVLAGCAGPQAPASGDIGNVQLRDLKSQGALLVDVRTKAEFDAGHIDGAVNVPVDEISTGAAGWDRTKPIIVYCQTGSRSLNAMGYLQGQGFQRVYNLEQGVAGWDGELVQGAGGTSGTVPDTSGPVMYAFMSDG